MGRPKGFKSKANSHLDPNCILQSRRKNVVNDENVNPCPSQTPDKPTKSRVGTRGAKKGKTSQSYHDLVGPPIEFFPKSKLPQTKVVLQGRHWLGVNGTCCRTLSPGMITGS